MTDEKGPDELAAELQAAIDPVLKRLDESAQWRNQPNHPELARLAAQHARRDFWRLQEAFNLAAGFTGKADTFPKRLRKDAAKTGPALGKVNGLKEMLPEYYQLRGWDEGGVPTAETLQRLGL